MRHYPREEIVVGHGFDVKNCSSDRCQKSMPKPRLQDFLSILQGYARKVEDKGPFIAKTKRSTKQ